MSIAGCLADHLAERPQRDALPVGEAAADQSVAAVGHFGVSSSPGAVDFPIPGGPATVRSAGSRSARCCRPQRPARRARRACPPAALRGAGRRRRAGAKCGEGERRPRPSAARPRRRWPPASGWSRPGRSHRAARRGRGRAAEPATVPTGLRIRTSSPRPWRSRCVARVIRSDSAAREDRPLSERREDASSSCSEGRPKVQSARPPVCASHRALVARDGVDTVLQRYDESPGKRLRIDRLPPPGSSATCRRSASCAPTAIWPAVPESGADDRATAPGPRISRSRSRSSSAGLEPELLDERATSVAVGGERLRLPARAVEREHQLGPETFPERVVGDQDLELGDELGPAVRARDRRRCGLRGQRSLSSSRRAISAWANGS